MRSIIINPYDRTITEADHSGGLDDLYATIRCNDICMVRVNRRADGSGDVLWLDDDGMLTEGKPVFELKGYPQWLAGIGLIMGVDDAGENAAAGIALKDVQAMVQWTDLETTGEMKGAGPVAAPPGVNFAITTGTPIYRKRATGGDA